jgi:hypothetical protein
MRQPVRVGAVVRVLVGIYRQTAVNSSILVVRCYRCCCHGAGRRSSTIRRRGREGHDNAVGGVNRDFEEDGVRVVGVDALNLREDGEERAELNVALVVRVLHFCPLWPSC